LVSRVTANEDHCHVSLRLSLANCYRAFDASAKIWRQVTVESDLTGGKNRIQFDAISGTWTKLVEDFPTTAPTPEPSFPEKTKATAWTLDSYRSTKNSSVEQFLWSVYELAFYKLPDCSAKSKLRTKTITSTRSSGFFYNDSDW
jgi:hypothetical protein